MWWWLNEEDGEWDVADTDDVEGISMRRFQLIENRLPIILLLHIVVAIRKLLLLVVVLVGGRRRS